MMLLYVRGVVEDARCAPFDRILSKMAQMADLVLADFDRIHNDSIRSALQLEGNNSPGLSDSFATCLSRHMPRNNEFRVNTA